MRHDHARNVGEGHRTVEIVRLEFAFHLFDQDVSVVHATQLERRGKRDLNHQVRGFARRTCAYTHHVVFLLDREAGRRDIDAFQTLRLVVRPFLFRRFASPQSSFDHDFLAVVTLDGDRARHQVDLHHARLRRIAERDRHPVRRYFLT